MLHLAQVQKQPASDALQLKMLARQLDDGAWKIEASTTIPLEESNFFSEGTLVLLEKNADNSVSDLKLATDWILNLLQQHSTKNAPHPQLVAEEQLKVEQWRQEITVQNLELNRQFLEIETRREQLQELEQSLKKDRKQLQELEDNLRKQQSEKAQPQS